MVGCVYDGRWAWLAICLLPGDVTAEETGLDPVNSDQDTVAVYGEFC